MTTTDYDLIIVGAGPAGLTAAIYAKRALLKLLLVEKDGLLGGKLNKTATVENYPGFGSIGGSDLAIQMTNQVANYQIERANSEIIKVEPHGQQFNLVDNQGQSFTTKAVIIAGGTVENKLLVNGEKELTNRGVSYCVICDGFLFREQAVAIVGGGYSALEAALYMSNLCPVVYLIHRRATFKVEPEILLQLQKKPNIQFFMEANVITIKGQQRVEAIIIKQNNTQRELAVKAVFPCIGLVPYSKLVHQLGICDQQQYIQVKANGATDIPGIFAAGDIASTGERKIKQIVTAVAEGATAAQAAISYLEEKDS
jgi:thioredoxin reductase (NADPH)